MENGEKEFIRHQPWKYIMIYSTWVDFLEEIPVTADIWSKRYFGDNWLTDTKQADHLLQCDLFANLQHFKVSQLNKVESIFYLTFEFSPTSSNIFDNTIHEMKIVKSFVQWLLLGFETFSCLWWEFWVHEIRFYIWKKYRTSIEKQSPVERREKS